MKAVVTKPFNGAKDGERYPSHFGVGAIVEGDLAAVAIDSGWAVEGETLPDGKSAAVVEIPGNWKELNEGETVALAQKLGAAETVKRKGAALAFIGSEVDRREQVARTAADAKAKTDKDAKPADPAKA